jgi:hypothetical protein
MVGDLALGVGAGVIGTACLTVLQEVSARLRRHTTVGIKHEVDPDEDPWKRAPAPAQLLKRGVEAVTGIEPDASAIPAYSNIVHWGYGIGLGAAYALAERRLRTRASIAGPLFGLGVWAQSYATLVPLGLYEWPWHYSPKVIAKDVSFHLAYGVGVAAGYEVLARGKG